MTDRDRQNGHGIVPSPNGDNGNGRNARGQFVKGNPGGPGNPHAGTVARLRAALLDCVAPEQVQSVMNNLHTLAVEGNVRASEVYLAYAVGKPTQTVAIKGETPNATATLDRMGELIRQYPALLDRLLPEGMRVVRTVGNDAPDEPGGGA